MTINLIINSHQYIFNTLGWKVIQLGLHNSLGFSSLGNPGLDHCVNSEVYENKDLHTIFCLHDGILFN